MIDPEELALAFRLEATTAALEDCRKQNEYLQNMLEYWRKKSYRLEKEKNQC